MSYVMHPNVKDYLCYVLDSNEARRVLGGGTMFHFDPRPKPYIDQWQPMEITFSALSGAKKGKIIPDITVRNGRLFLSQKAYDCLSGMLGDHGEFLPITFGDESAYLFNILAVADDVGGLDEKLSTKDEFDEMKSLAFHQDKVEGFSVFRTAFNNFMYVYCNATLKQAIEHEKLTAVIFSKDLGNMFPPDVSVFRVVSLLLLTFSQLTAFSSS